MRVFFSLLKFEQNIDYITNWFLVLRLCKKHLLYLDFTKYKQIIGHKPNSQQTVMNKRIKSSFIAQIFFENI